MKTALPSRSFMRRLAQKWLLLLPFFIFFFLFLKGPVFATSTSNVAAANVTAPQNYQSTNNQYLTPATNPDVPKNMHTYTQSVAIEFMATAFCQLTGYDPLSQNHKCLGIDSETNKIGFVEGGGGLIGATTGLIAMTFQMPTSSSQYINYLAGNFGLTKKAYAATDCPNIGSNRNGYGFCSIQPLTNIWSSMRDIVYLLFTVIFVIIGLAIMLRLHIDPRTVMTAENQIPKIIVGILLVTFSLAIAGLLIDVMYIAIYLIGNVLNDVAIKLNIADFAATYFSIVSSSSPIQAAGNFNTDIVKAMASGVANLITGNIKSIFDVPFIGDLGKGLVWLILWIIFLLAFWITLLRIWITLVMAYIMILLDIVFAPFWFVLGLLPGGSLGVGAWFRDILANLAVFPTTIAMFALAIIFGNMGSGQIQGLFNPPLVGAVSAMTLGQLIMFGFIFMTPQALTIMKAAFKAPKFNLGPVFAPAGAAAGVIKSGTSAAMMSRTTAGEEMANARGFRRVFTKVIG